MPPQNCRNIADIFMHLRESIVESMIQIFLTFIPDGQIDD